MREEEYQLNRRKAKTRDNIAGAVHIAVKTEAIP